MGGRHGLIGDCWFPQLVFLIPRTASPTGTTQYQVDRKCLVHDAYIPSAQFLVLTTAGEVVLGDIANSGQPPIIGKEMRRFVIGGAAIHLKCGAPNPGSMALVA